MKDEAAVKTSEVRCDRRRQSGTGVVHGQKQAFNLKLRIQELPYSSQRVEEFGHALEGIVFTLNGNKEGVRSRESIESEQVQRRRAVKNYVVVTIADRGEGLSQKQLAIWKVDYFHLRPG